MSKRSVVTVRERPLSATTSVSGPMRVHAEIIKVQSAERLHIVDVTERVMALVRESAISEGLVSVASTHTTCTLFINEFQQALVEDIRSFLEQIAPREAPWRHNDPRLSDCDRMNADSHLRALLLGHTLTLQVSDGDVVLGQWQRILMAELDGPRERTLRVQVLGV